MAFNRAKRTVTQLGSQQEDYAYGGKEKKEIDWTKVKPPARMFANERKPQTVNEVRIRATKDNMWSRIRSSDTTMGAFAAPKTKEEEEQEEEQAEERKNAKNAYAT